MTRWALAAILAGALSAGAGFAAATDPWNWGTAHDPYEDAHSGHSKAICRQLSAPVIPAADRPTAAEAARLKGCDSESLYYGIGAAPDFVAARKCAIIERDAAAQVETGFTGTTLLMQIYANGLGVPRNRTLATQLACADQDAAPAESDGRILHLQAMKPNETFAWCDDVTSGLHQGHCAQHEENLAQIVREAKLAKLVARLPAGAAPLYQALKKTADTFSSAYGENDTDASGTDRFVGWVANKQRQDDQFVTDLERLAAQKWPAATAADAQAADRALNQAYRRALARAAAKDNYTTIKPADIRETQRIWLPYRDAWVRLGVAAHLSPDAVLTRITRLRLAQLESLN